MIKSKHYFVFATKSITFGLASLTGNWVYSEQAEAILTSLLVAGEIQTKLFWILLFTAQWPTLKQRCRLFADHLLPARI